MGYEKWIQENTGNVCKLFQVSLASSVRESWWQVRNTCCVYVHNAKLCAFMLHLPVGVQTLVVRFEMEMCERERERERQRVSKGSDVSFNVYKSTAWCLSPPLLGVTMVASPDHCIDCWLLFALITCMWITLLHWFLNWGPGDPQGSVTGF